MTRVFILNPPFNNKTFIRVARWDGISISKSIWYPIHLAYCTGLLEKNRHSVTLVDAISDRLSVDDVLEKIRQFSPDIAVINYSTFSSAEDIAMADAIKDAVGCVTVLVGPCCSINPGKTLSESRKIDALVRGEFEYTILDLSNGVPKENIKGLSWRKNSEIIQNEDRPPMSPAQIEEFPFVTDVYSRHLTIRNYYQSPHLHPFIDLFTGRSCSYNKCSFCMWPFTINKNAPYRTRSIENVIEELKFVKKKLPFVKEIFIQDDTLPKDRARELSNAILESGLDIIWSCYSRATLDYDTLSLMKKSGCRALHVGYESADPRILQISNKGITPEGAFRFTNDVHKAGLQIHADFMIGLPGETPESIRKTISFAKSLNADSYQFVLPRLYEGTPLYEWLSRHGNIENGQVNYPDLSYEELDNWVHVAMKECMFSRQFIFRYVSRAFSNPREVKRAFIAGIHILPYVFARTKK
jgi:radical SAM superfamily enzyme YgiQ (UPF0313 family)